MESGREMAQKPPYLFLLWDEVAKHLNKHNQPLPVNTRMLLTSFGSQAAMPSVLSLYGLFHRAHPDHGGVEIALSGAMSACLVHGTARGSRLASCRSLPHFLAKEVGEWKSGPSIPAGWIWLSPLSAPMHRPQCTATITNSHATRYRCLRDCASNRGHKIVLQRHWRAQSR